MDSNNKTEIAGIVSEPLMFSHEIFGEQFYKTSIYVQRISGNGDYINVILSERLPVVKNIRKDSNILVKGEFRSYNNISGSGSRLILSVFCKEVELSTSQEIKYINSIELCGYICKPVCYRKTPFGREITDILLAVNRSFNKSDYIPCITWGRNAGYAEGLSVGAKLTVYGRIQSRNYIKQTEHGDEERTAYEVSVSRYEVEKSDKYDTE